MEKERYILSIDQSTQETKVFLFSENGELVKKTSRKHAQIVNEIGWVSHDTEEIFSNLKECIKEIVSDKHVDSNAIVSVAISNQRETTVAWNRNTGKQLCNAIVWQCSRAVEICNKVCEKGFGDMIGQRTGIPVSPFFPASKMAWLIRNSEEVKRASAEGTLCLGTIDSFLVFKLTGGSVFATDYSNASRTQLFNIRTLEWDDDILSAFGLQKEWLAQVSDSNASFGETDFDGILSRKIPIVAVAGDSHASLFAHRCYEKGTVKATYGTGSSVMMNIGDAPVVSKNGLVTSIAWGLSGKISYVMEGNINYSGAVVSWLKDNLGIISDPSETQNLAMKASPNDRTVLVPAFSGLGAPYWKSDATAFLYGMTRSTGKAEIVKACLESIVFQISDVIGCMSKDTGIKPARLNVDGGPTANRFLMQFQSDIAEIPVWVSDFEDLSALGVFLMAISGKTDKEESSCCSVYEPRMKDSERKDRYSVWNKAVGLCLTADKNNTSGLT